jgi:flagellar basal body-associated protein FliL
MNQYLQQILKEINTIIIPELGALTITNPTEGTVLFMPYLKYDDGKLANFIADKEGLPVADAKNMIARYVREITSNLDQGDSYDMFEFGSFSKNKDGDIIFTNWDRVSVSTDSKEEAKSEPEIPTEVEKTEEKTIEEATIPEPEIIEEIVKEEIPEEVVPEPIQEIETPKEEEVTEEVEEEDEDVKLEVFPIDASEPIVEIPEEVVSKEETPKKESKKPTPPKPKEEKPVKPKKEKLVKEKKEKEENPKRRKTVLIILITLLLAAGGAFAYCYFQHMTHGNVEHHEKDTLNTHSTTNSEEGHPNDGTNANSENQEEEQDSDLTEGEESQNETTDKEPVQIEETVTSTKPIASNSGSSATSGTFYIILNAFTEEENAVNFISSLKSQGKNALNIGQINQLHLIGIGGYNSREEAFSNLEAEKANYPGAWVYQKK